MSLHEEERKFWGIRLLKMFCLRQFILFFDTRVLEHIYDSQSDTAIRIITQTIQSENLTEYISAKQTYNCELIRNSSNH